MEGTFGARLVRAHRREWWGAFLVGTGDERHLQVRSTSSAWHESGPDGVGSLRGDAVMELQEG